MLGFTEDIKIISSYQNKSKPYGKIESRLTDGFIFRIRGVSEYYFNGKTLTAKEGDLVFLPKGASYEYRTQNAEDSLYTSINFLASVDLSDIKIFSLRDFHSAGYIANSFTELWKFGTEADKYKCLSLFYELLSYLVRVEGISDSTKTRHSVIAPAVDYLKSHIYDSELKIEKLHKICAVSDTYFRRLFTERFGISPKEYVTKERITHAKSIIESGDFESISEVAWLVGFSDPLYFSKAFKRHYGYPPSKTNV